MTGTMVAAETCSLSSARVHEPLAGTAPLALGWIVLEEPGPWGRDVFDGSTFEPRLVQALEDLRITTSVRTIAARHASRRRLTPTSPRNVWLATCSATGSHIRHVFVDSLVEILDWDLGAIADGHLPDVGMELSHSVEFVCTHSGRDRCCAEFGRARAAARPGAWECSHLGGHRFAATSLNLPSGRVFGRLGATADADLQVANMRGCCFLSSPEQVADIAVRENARLDPWVPLTTTIRSPGEATTVVDVEDAAGRAWSVLCEPAAFLRRASCSATEENVMSWTATAVEMRL